MQAASDQYTSDSLGSEEASDNEQSRAMIYDGYSGSESDELSDCSMHSDILDSVLIESNNLKANEVDYFVKDLTDIHREQEEQIEHIKSFLDLSRDEIALLLRRFKWKPEQLLERYMENPESVASEAGIALGSNSSLPYIRQHGSFFCAVCCDNEPTCDVFALACKHEYCADCYRKYVAEKVITQGEADIHCLNPECKLHFTEGAARTLLGSDLLARYLKLLDIQYFRDNEYVRFCPAPNCNYAVYCKIGQRELRNQVPSVQCKCGCWFCFGCGMEEHQPCPCFIVRAWLKKIREDSDTANWISENTKECPKCLMTIEKNGGCNHMTCKKCKYEFCWVCMGPWTEHGANWYNCNRFDENSSVKARESLAVTRRTLKRYLHYYNRYANHQQSAKLEKDMLYKTEQKMTEIQIASDLSWIEVQFLKTAIDTLVKCRHTLQWTYAFAYYLSRDNMTVIFEDNQRDLELAVEILSELCEQPIELPSVQALKQSVLDRTVYVQGRLKILLEDAAIGLKDGRWKFDLNIDKQAESTKN